MPFIWLPSIHEQTGSIRAIEPYRFGPRVHYNESDALGDAEVDAVADETFSAAPAREPGPRRAAHRIANLRFVPSRFRVFARNSAMSLVHPSALKIETGDLVR